jgi:GntR family transcriptional regulator
MRPSADQPGFRPLYQQVRDLLRQRITEGVWGPGEPLPAEPRLAAELGVSQGTVRKALDELAAANLVDRHQGRGTYVTRQTAERALFHFFHIVDATGRRVIPSSRTLDCRRGVGTARETERLAARPGAMVIRIARLRTLDARPALVERIAVPASLFPDLGGDGDLPNTLYELYQRRYGVTIARATEHLRAVAADGDDAGLLGVPPATPVLEIDRVAFDLEDRPVEWRLSRLSCSDFAYLSELT